MQPPLVSIIIPTYNQAEFIQAAVETACGQLYQPLEIIVSDDASDDQTQELLDKYRKDPRVKIFRNPERLGRVANYRKALYDYASGDLALVCDGDDYFLNKDYIKNAVAAILEKSSVDKIAFYQGGHLMKYQDGTAPRECRPAIQNQVIRLDGASYVKNFRSYHHFSHLPTLYNRKQALLIDFYNTQILSSDMESLLRLAITGDVMLSKEIAGVWLQHSSNASATANQKKLIENLIWIKQIRDFAISRGQSKISFNWWAMNMQLSERSSIFCHQAKKLLQQNKFADIFIMFFEFIREQPLLLFYPLFLKKTMDIIIFRK